MTDRVEPRPLRLAVTADLHWGPHASGNAATRELRDFLRANPTDVLILAGDIGAGEDFGPCLALFADLPGHKALVPGNHDIWVRPDDARGDSLAVYREHLPRLAAEHGFHYLDHGPLFLPESDLALVGSMNWYDYSWSVDELRREFPGEEDRLRSKVFMRGRHNDARFVRWPLDDIRFTKEVVEAFDRHLNEALARVSQAIVVVHHPPFFGLNVPRSGPPSLDRLLWEAFSGNAAMEAVLQHHAERIPLVFCGHTHRARENTLGPIRGYNVGSDYSFKRLLMVDWPEGIVTTHTFDPPPA
jgi:3',5'-cyclic AMP phosphodiesterase CpdA